MTEQEFVDLIFGEEGRTYAEPPRADQPTGPGGVTLPELLAFRARPVLLADLKALTIAEATQIIKRRFHDPDLAGVMNEALRVHMLDYAYNSGKARAVRWLQRTANAFLSARATVDPLTIDGILGVRTLAVINSLPPIPLNNALAGERAHAAYAVLDPKFAPGVARRALTFVIPLD